MEIFAFKVVPKCFKVLHVKYTNFQFNHDISSSNWWFKIGIMDSEG